MEEYPQVFIVSNSGKADKVDIKPTKDSLTNLIASISKPRKRMATTIDLQSSKDSYLSGLKAFISSFWLGFQDLKSKLRNLLYNDPVLGSLLFIMNVLFLSASWKFSGLLINSLFYFISESNLNQSSMSMSKKSN